MIIIKLDIKKVCYILYRMAIQLNAANYQQLVDSISGLFAAGGISGVTISIYEDATATTFLTDSLGNPINSLLVYKTVLTPTVQNAEGNTIIGNITITFNGDSEYVAIDQGSSAWYVLSTKSYR
jgi:hypothetical protein